MSSSPGAPRYVYTATVTHVHDGDTFDAAVILGYWRGVNHDFGFHLKRTGNTLTLTVPFRLAACNAAELITPAGAAAAQNLQALMPVGQVVLIHSHKPLTPVPDDKYARYDADVTLPDNTDLVTLLTAQQWVAPWDGGGTKPVPPWPRTVVAPMTGRRLP